MRKILHVVCLIVCLLALTVNALGCSSSSSRDWERDAYQQGYYKGANGKWYHK